VELAPQRWRSRISRLTTIADGTRHQELERWQAPLPTSSLAAERAGVGARWFVGLGHPPFRREPQPQLCHSNARSSGSVLALIPPAPSSSR
jgi:hypothetical protein